MKCFEAAPAVTASYCAATQLDSVCTADTISTLADTADAGCGKKRGRPKGVGKPRVRTMRFDIESAVRMFADTASKKPSNEWNWDGTSYPKTKRSHGPCVESLNKHAEVLSILVHFAPNGYPDPYVLRDLLAKLHSIFDIFTNPFYESHSEEKHSLSTRAMLASDRWRIMCKHCLMLVKSGMAVPHPALRKVLARMKPEIGTPAESASSLIPLDATTSTNLHECDIDWSIPTSAPPADTATERTSVRRSTPGPRIPYLPDGTLDWASIEESLPTPESETTWECEIAAIDWSKPQGSNLHPYFHRVEGDYDCVVIGHKCSCPDCMETTPAAVVDLHTPPRRPQAVTAPSDRLLQPDAPGERPPTQHLIARVSAALAEQRSTEKARMPNANAAPQHVEAESVPHKIRRSLQIPPNIFSQLECMADNAPCPAPAGIERMESMESGRPGRPKRLVRKTTVANSQFTVEDQPAKKPKKKDNIALPQLGSPWDGEQADTAGKPQADKEKSGGQADTAALPVDKGRGKAAASKKRKSCEIDGILSGPYKLIHRWTPLEKAQCYMMGKVGKKKNRIITNISAMMDHQFSAKMFVLLQEAKNGCFMRKDDAVRRRDELVALADTAEAAAPAVTAEVAAQAAAGEDIN